MNVNHLTGFAILKFFFTNVFLAIIPTIAESIIPKIISPKLQLKKSLFNITISVPLPVVNKRYVSIWRINTREGS